MADNGNALYNMIKLMTAHGVRVSTKDAASWSAMSDSDPEGFNDLVGRVNYGYNIYGKKYTKLAGTPSIQNQYKYYQQRTQAGLDPIIIKDVNWDPSTYDDTTNEALSKWYGHNHHLPQGYESAAWNSFLDEYKTNKTLKANAQILQDLADQTKARQDAYKGQYDLSTVEDKYNYDHGLAPMKVQNAEKTAQQMTDFQTKADSLMKQPGTTFDDIQKLWNSYSLLKQYQDYAHDQQLPTDARAEQAAMRSIDTQKAREEQQINDSLAAYGARQSTPDNPADLGWMADKNGYIHSNDIVSHNTKNKNGHYIIIPNSDGSATLTYASYDTGAPEANSVSEVFSSPQRAQEAANIYAKQIESGMPVSSVQKQFQQEDAKKELAYAPQDIKDTENFFQDWLFNPVARGWENIKSVGAEVGRAFNPNNTQFTAQVIRDMATGQPIDDKLKTQHNEQAAQLQAQGVPTTSNPVFNPWMNSAPVAALMGAADEASMGMPELTARLAEATAQLMGAKVTAQPTGVQEIMNEHPAATNIGRMAGQAMPIAGAENLIKEAPHYVAMVSPIGKEAIRGALSFAAPSLIRDLSTGVPALQVASNLVSNMAAGALGNAAYKMINDIAGGWLPIPGSAQWKQMAASGELVQRLAPYTEQIALGMKEADIPKGGKSEFAWKPKNQPEATSPEAAPAGTQGTAAPAREPEFNLVEQAAATHAPEAHGVKPAAADDADLIAQYYSKDRQHWQAPADQAGVVAEAADKAGIEDPVVAVEYDGAGKTMKSVKGFMNEADAQAYASKLENAKVYRMERAGDGSVSQVYTVNPTYKGKPQEPQSFYAFLQENGRQPAGQANLFEGQGGNAAAGNAMPATQAKATSTPNASADMLGQGGERPTTGAPGRAGGAPKITYDTNPARVPFSEHVRNVKSAVRKVYQQTVSGQAVLERISKIQNPNETTMNDLVQAVRNAGSQVNYIAKDGMTNLEGNTIGPSWKSIMDEVPVKEQNAFNEYLLNRLNVERAKAEKPVFFGRTAEESQAIVDDLGRQYPEFKNYANNVYDFIHASDVEHLQRSGLLSADDVAKLEATYEDYVPAYRKNWQGKTQQTADVKATDRTSVSPGEVIHEAVGGSSEIVPIQDSVMRKVNRNVKAARVNELYRGIYHWALEHPQESAGFVDIVKPGEESNFLKNAENLDDLVDKFGRENLQEVRDGVYRMTAYEDGKPITANISKDVYDALESLGGKNVGTDPKNWMRVAGYFTNPMKALITGYNPMFIVRNIFRDLPTYWQYSAGGPIQSIKNLGTAMKEMLTDGEKWRTYQAMGGGEANFYNNYKGFSQSNKPSFFETLASGDLKQAPAAAGRSVKNALGKVGSTTEALPRFAEYLNSIEKYGDTYMGRLRAMADAADVTTNFSRSGPWTKDKDAWVPYLNAYTQGLDKFVRAALGRAGRTGAESLKIAAKTWSKIVVSVGVPTITLYEINKSNPYYQDLDNNTKDSYFLFPNINNLDASGNAKTFIKIPKPREAGVFAAALERGLRAMDGDKQPFKGLQKAFATNFAPQNPLTQNVFSPFLYGLLNNKDFAGRDIVPQSMKNLEPKYQYDANTSAVAKQVGQWFDVSPKQIDYLLREYTGVIGQVGLPMTTGQPETAKDFMSQLFLSPLKQNFTANPTNQSQIITDFYDLMDEATKKSKTRNFEESIPGAYSTPEERMLSGLTKASQQITALRKQEQNVLASSAPQSDKDIQVQQLRQQAIDIAKASIAAYQAGTTDTKIYPFTNNAATEDKYNAMVDHGINPDDVTKVFTGLDGLTPGSGHKTVTDDQKRNFIWYQMPELTEKQRRIAIYDLGLWKKEFGPPPEGVQ